MENTLKIFFLFSATIIGQITLNCYIHKNRKCFLIENPKEALQCFKSTYTHTDCEIGQTICVTETIVAKDNTTIYIGRCDIEDGLRDRNNTWQTKCINDLKKNFAHVDIKEAHCAICREALCNTKARNVASNNRKFSLVILLFLKFI